MKNRYKIAKIHINRWIAIIGNITIGYYNNFSGEIGFELTYYL
jgi:hypothetical protein